MKQTNSNLTTTIKPQSNKYTLSHTHTHTLTPFLEQTHHIEGMHPSTTLTRSASNSFITRRSSSTSNPPSCSSASAPGTLATFFCSSALSRRICLYFGSAFPAFCRIARTVFSARRPAFPAVCSISEATNNCARSSSVFSAGILPPKTPPILLRLLLFRGYSVILAPQLQLPLPLFFRGNLFPPFLLRFALPLRSLQLRALQLVHFPALDPLLLPRFFPRFFFPRFFFAPLLDFGAHFLHAALEVRRILRRIRR